ncbi:MAG: DUF3617 domain-containing protein [Sphingomonadaceae bacterium]
MTKTAGKASLAGAVAIGMFAPVFAQAPAMQMLSGLQKGQWELRFRGSEPARKICVRNGQELIQIAHREAGCSRYVVEDSPQAVTVQYTCKGNGYGRTAIRKETGRLVQIQSQGIAGDRPFQFTAEGRYVGQCS